MENAKKIVASSIYTEGAGIAAWFALTEALNEIERLNRELAEVKKWLHGQAMLLEELRK